MRDARNGGVGQAWGVRGSVAGRGGGSTPCLLSRAGLATLTAPGEIMAHDDDDLDFTALMRGQGVEPVKPAARGRGRREPVGPALKRGVVGGQRAPVSTVAAPVKRATPAPVARQPAPVVKARQAVVEPELVAARAESQTRQVALERVTGERDELVARVEQLTKERDAAQRARAAAEATAAAPAGLAVQRAPPPSLEVPRLSLAEALVARGVTEPAEQARALAALASTESAPRLISALESRDIAGLRSALERRLALLCGSPDCTAPAGAVVIEVKPARCELCGGSEIQRAATRFIRACEAAGISRVRFVGGSPNYRTQLEELFPRRGPLTVATTAGDRRVSLQKAKAQQRSDDLVVIWGATELDHATSGAYRAQFGRVETIAHRGIGRMLDLAAERIIAS